MIKDGGPLPWYTTLVVAAFLFDWLAVAFSWLKIKPISKSLAMILVIFWTLKTVGFELNLSIGLLVIAQSFGLAGDIFLLFPQGWFQWGLVSFLMGHLFYLLLMTLLLIGYFLTGLIEPLSIWAIVLCMSVWALLIGAFYWVFRVDINPLRSVKRLWVASQIYAFVLSGLTVFSFLIVILLPGFWGSRLLLPLGGFLFLASDFFLVYDRFVNRMARGQLWVRITYHLAQFSLAWGFLAIIR